MTTSARPITQHDESGPLLACIVAQEVMWAEPLREYLEHHGCRVVVNVDVGDTPAYIIVVGDTEYVKVFFEGKTWTHAKKMAVVYEGDADDLLRIRSLGIKQYFLDPVPLDEKRTQDIFAFFFTGREMVTNVRKAPTPTKKIGVLPKEAAREESTETKKQMTTDQARIATELRRVYIKKHQPKHNGFSNQGRTYAVWIGAIFLTIIAAVVFYLLSVLTSAGLLVIAGKTLTNGNTRWTNTLITSSGTYRNLAHSILTLASPVFMVVGKNGIVEDQDRLLSILTQISSVESGVLTIYSSSKKVAGGIFFPHDASQAAGVSDVIALATEVSRVSQHLGLVAAQLDSLIQTRRFPFHTRMISQLTSRAIEKLISLRRIVDYTNKLLTLYPQSAGFRKKQTYLVLLQNSMEIRPTGGFIGSLLVVSFVDGKVESLEVQDVYTADGQLKGHIDPPLPIREILGVEHWYLRDSNWDPDFAKSGAQAAWFYEKEMNRSVDGVIALSLPMVTRLLNVTGPIELLDFNERISENNFFAKSLLYTQATFFPGSTQKKDFLGALTSALLTRITTDASISTGALLTVLSEAIEARDVQFYFMDVELQALVTQWGWDGGVSTQECRTIYEGVSCTGDGIGVVDANLGVNKANFFVKRGAVSEIYLRENGDIDHTLAINIKNTAPLKEDGEGAYLSYMRFLLPIDTTLLTVALDGATVPVRDPKSASPPPAPYVVLERTPTLTLIHVLFKVNTRQTKQLTLKWVRQGVVRFETKVGYQFTIRKQPGVTSFPWRTVVQYPQYWGVAREEDGVAKEGALEYNTDLTKDASYRMLFQKYQ